MLGLYGWEQRTRYATVFSPQNEAELEHFKCFIRCCIPEDGEHCWDVTVLRHGQKGA